MPTTVFVLQIRDYEMEWEVDDVEKAVKSYTLPSQKEKFVDSRPPRPDVTIIRLSAEEE